MVDFMPILKLSWYQSEKSYTGETLGSPTFSLGVFRLPFSQFSPYSSTNNVRSFINFWEFYHPKGIKILIWQKHSAPSTCILQLHFPTPGVLSLMFRGSISRAFFQQRGSSFVDPLLGRRGPL